MATESAQRFVYIPCSLCHGSGVQAGQSCPQCNGRGAYLWLENEFFYWGRVIDTFHIFERELEQTTRLILNGFLLLFGILGIAALVLAVLQSMTQAGDPFAAFTSRSPLMSLFAISLVADLYVYYRFQRQSFLQKTVKGKSYESPVTDLPVEELFSQAVAQGKRANDVSLAYSQEAHRMVEQAWQLARRLKHGSVEPLHLFGTLLANQKSRVILARLGVDVRILTDKISRVLERAPIVEGTPVFSPALRTILLAAYKEASMTRQRTVDAPQLFAAIVEHDQHSRNILYDMEIEYDDVRNVVEWINIQQRFSARWRSWQSKARHKPKGVVDRAMTAVATPLLDKFSRDLTLLARSGVLPPALGRENEIEAVFRTLESGKNALLVGNPGVGKTSIVEGIAELMTSEEVPPFLQDKRFVSISIASLVGASGRQGELEGRLTDIMNEITRAGNIVVFIDGIEKMIGISTEGAQNLDVADIFGQALQRKLFWCIATTTPPDFRRYVEHSSLLEVFAPVIVDEPNTNDTILVLEGKAGPIEVKHLVYFSYSAIEKIVEMSQRYIHDRFLPEKAISLLEEVAVYARKKHGKHSIVRGDEVAEVVAQRTHIPVTRVTQQEGERLMNLEKRIHERMVDQEEAVGAVATALRRARAELRDVRRPIVNLLFLGPTGVGKTELAKTVAEVYFGSENTMIRLDMSEYQEKSSINRLIGAPPGYRGEGEGGFLTDAVRANPFSLVLLDEIEKAHPDILNIFLQVMDDGRLTDTLGRTIDFTNVILIGTSNAGTPLIMQRVREGVPMERIKRELLEEALGQYFRPEFLNRFDHVVVFKPLGMEEVVKITELLLKQVAANLQPKGITFRASKEAIAELAQVGFDPVFGARPLRRAIQERVDNALANYLLQGRIGRRDIAILDVGGAIRVEKAEQL